MNKYLHIGPMGHCWVSDVENKNRYGVSYEAMEAFVENKMAVNYGNNIVSGEMTEDGTFIVDKVISSKKVTIIAGFVQKKDREFFTIMNAGLYKTFNLNEVQGTFGKPPRDGEMYVFEKSVDGTYTLKNRFGHIRDNGIETKLVMTLGDISGEEISIQQEIKLPTYPKMDLPFVTVDGLSTTDIDDAIGFEKTDDGYIIHVAIADVAGAVPLGSKLDNDALLHSTSFYLPHQKINMMPKLLSEDLCSLKPGVPRNAVVCSMHFTDAGMTYEFNHRQILSHTRYTYDDVDRIINGEPTIESVYTTKVDTDAIIRDLYAHRPVMEDKQSDFIKFPEPALGEDGKVAYLFLEDENTPSQKLVSSLMLTANRCAAMRMQELGTGIFRNQENIETGASYALGNQGHKSIGFEQYTHFTSPIRRYVDFIIHHLLRGGEPDLERIIKRVNRQALKAKFLERRANNLLIAQYVANLCRTKSLDTHFKAIQINEKGVLFRNSQLVDVFVRFDKLDLDCSNLPEDKNEALEWVNQNHFEINVFYRWSDVAKGYDVRVTPPERAPSFC